MNKSTAVLSVLLFLLLSGAIAQKESSKEFANFDYESRYFTPEKSFDFITQYGLETSVIEIYITLEDVNIRNKPDFNGGTYDIVIPEGSTVEVYKYLAKQAFYIVRYDDVWGFIPATTVIKKKNVKKRFHVSEVDQPPKLISKLVVSYPETGNAKTKEGTVVLKIFISKTGAVTNAVVEQSVPGLDEQAIKIVKELKFKPAMHGGKPVEVFENFPVEFNPKLIQ